MWSRVAAVLAASTLVCLMFSGTVPTGSGGATPLPVAGAAEPQSVPTAPGTDFPRVLYARVDPATPCDSDPRVSLLIYSPTAWILRERLTYRVRIGATLVATGNVTASGWETRAPDFTIPLAAIPAETTTLAIDARGPAGIWGPAWVQDIGRDCDPLRVLGLGDSVTWAIGVENQDKWVPLVARGLGERTGRVPEVHLLARTGVSLDHNPGQMPDDTRCPAVYADPATGDWLGDGHVVDGDRNIPGWEPDVFCQVWRARKLATATGTEFDAVVMTGCANDIGMLTAVAFSLSTEGVDLEAANDRECGGGPPLPGATEWGLGGRGLHEALLAAHALPGNPKVVLAGYYRPVTEVGIAVFEAGCNLVDGVAPLPNFCRNLTERAVMRSDRWYVDHTDLARREVDLANAAAPGDPFAVFVEPELLLSEGTSFPPGPDTKFQDYASGPLVGMRIAECLHRFPSPICMVSQTGHPNRAGNAQYADAILKDSTVRSWFGSVVDDPTVAVTAVAAHAPAPTDVAFTASVTPGADAVSSYHWSFGDGTDATTQEPAVTHTYTSFGSFWPVLTVTDAAGRTGTATPPQAVEIAAGVELEVDSPRTPIATTDVVTLRAHPPAGSDLATWRVEYRWDVDGDGSVDRVTRAPEYTTTFERYGPGVQSPSVAISHITVSYAVPSPPLVTATSSDIEVVEGCPVADPDRDGIPCPYDPDGGTRAFSRLVPAVQLPAGTAIGPDVIVRRLDVHRLGSLWSFPAFGAVEIEEPNPADAARPRARFFSLIVTAAVESGDGAAYLAGTGLCLAADTREFTEYRIGNCGWRMAVTRSGAGGSIRFDADLPGAGIHAAGNF